MVNVVDEPLAVPESITQADPSRLCSILYEATVEDGAVQLSANDPAPGVISKAVGALGSAWAVAVAGVEAAPTPALVIAATRKRSGMPTKVAV